MSSISTKGAFSGNIDFCSECGAILPLPSNEEAIVCRVCKHKINVCEFDGLEMTSRIVFNDREQILKNKGKKREAIPAGPLVDRKCAKCGHEGMTYATLQTRSADEGQTVFYSCPHCQFQENENS